MRLDISDDAYKFIKKKGGVCTLRLTVASGCCGSLPLPEITFVKPKETASLHALIRDDVSVYVGKSMHFEDDVVVIRLSGVLFLKSLELPSLRLLEVCERRS